MPSRPLPSVVIVGRPNVGKSTLFNRLVGKRRAIVGDESGITRDRIHGEAEWLGRPFELIDTGGLVPHDDDTLLSQILKQAQLALANAAHIIFLIDGRTEITGTDLELCQMLRRLAKPVSLAVNKIDAPPRESLAHDFHSLGFEHTFPISAEHGLGVAELLDHVTASFPASTTDERAAASAIKVAIVGRPNVGKSTLLNALAGSERTIVSPEACTTRDAVDETVLRDGIEYVFVDTAGIRRKGKTRLMAEKLSVVMARRHIRMADVVLLVVDAADGVVSLDATIGGYAHEGGRPVIVAVNKWDAVEDKNKFAFLKRVRGSMKYLDYAPLAFLSALRKAGLEQLFGLIQRGYEAASQRVPTAELNRFAGTLETGPGVKVKYMTQTGVRPPTFVVFTDGPRKLHFSKERYLANMLRKEYGFGGTPIRIKARSSRKRR